MKYSCRMQSRSKPLPRLGGIKDPRRAERYHEQKYAIQKGNSTSDNGASMKRNIPTALTRVITPKITACLPFECAMRPFGRIMET